MRLILRWVGLTFICIAGGILLMRAIGTVTSPYPPLVGQNFTTGTVSGAYLDTITHVAYRSDDLYATFDPLARFGVSYREQRDDDLTNIYIQHGEDAEEQLIATVPRESVPIITTWSYDLSEPMYIVEALPDEEDQIIIKVVDMVTGDWHIQGTYHFVGTPNTVYHINEAVMLIRRWNSGYFGLLNLETDAYFTDRHEASAGAYFQFTQTNIYYRASHDFENDNPLSNTYFEINLATLEREALLPPRDDVTIKEFSLYGLIDQQLVMVDDQDYLWIYDIADKTYTPLPHDYRSGKTSVSWSPDDDRLTLMRLIDEETVELGIYTPATDDYLPLWTLTDYSASVTLFLYYSVQWSPDGKYVLISHSSDTRGYTFRAYDTRTGKLMFDQNSVSNFDFDFVSWWWGD